LTSATLDLPKCDTRPALENPKSLAGLGFPAPFKRFSKERSKGAHVRAYARDLYMAIDSLRYTTLRSDGKQLNGKQQQKPVVAAALSESSSGVNRWRTLSRAG
jgi:hypothetical protein